MNWDDYRFFQAVKKSKTLKTAALLLQTDQATVGRRLYALEDRLGTKLFEKRSNGYFLTQAGERLGESIDLIESEFEGVSRKLAGDDIRLEGTIKIGAPGGLANHLLIPGLRNFTAQYPGITLQFLTGPEILNLSKREADLAIRIVRPHQHNLQIKKLGTMSLGLYGLKSYLAEHPQINHISDFKNIAFVGLVDDSMNDMEEKLLSPFRDQLRYVMKTHAWSSVYAGVAGGLGIGVLPDFIAKQNSKLALIPFASPVPQPVWLVLHPDLKNNARIKVLIDAIKLLFKDQK